MEKIQTKVAQMNKTECDKCKDGQRFNVDIITNAKKKITLEDIMDKLNRIETRLDNLEIRMDRLETRLDDIVKVNNLKETHTPSLQ